jgi:hypothetical protein
MWKYSEAHVREYSVTTEPYRSKGDMRNAYKILASQLNRSDHLEDLKTQKENNIIMWGCGLDSVGLGCGPVAHSRVV